MLRRLLLGRPLRTDEQASEQLGSAKAVPVLGLDALASAAYGPEAALTVLIAAGAAASHLLGWIIAAVVAVLALVYLSYLQTLEAYPNGGGSYTVAKENLGPRWGVIAATALCTDYVLNVAVAIAAGVGALVSVFPRLLPYTLPLCLLILALLTLVNLRGIRTSGLVFTVPAYAFVLGLGATMCAGLWRISFRASSMSTMSTSPVPAAVGVWLVLRAFASGCTALTGVEAVSNAVPIFQAPSVRHAKQTLTAIVVLLALLLVGVALFTNAFGIVAKPPGQPGYESVLSQVTATVLGRGTAYALVMASVLLVLCLSANTSFADFPRVCRLLADDGYLPSTFAVRGERLVYSAGIMVLTMLAALLLAVFGGVTDALIPLFAVGAFSAFTLSQAGMVFHWRRERHRFRMVCNGAGAVATGASLVVIIAAKFIEGAWLTLIIIPVGYAFFVYTQRVHERTSVQLTPTEPLDVANLRPPVAVVPVHRVDRSAIKAIRFALSMGADVHGVHVITEGERQDDVEHAWHMLIEQPAHAAGLRAPRLRVVRSPYRRIVRPLLASIRELADLYRDRTIAVVIPEPIEPRWYQMWLHSQRATFLKLVLLMRGGPRVAVIDTPWYVRDSA